MHLENTGSKIYRGLVETVGIKKSAGSSTEYLHLHLLNICWVVVIVNKCGHITFVICLIIISFIFARSQFIIELNRQDITQCSAPDNL